MGRNPSTHGNHTLVLGKKEHLSLSLAHVQSVSEINDVSIHKKIPDLAGHFIFGIFLIFNPIHCPSKSNFVSSQSY